MLEARRVRGVARNGDVDVLEVHDGNAFLHGVRAVALDLRALRIAAVDDLVDDIDLVRLVVIVRHDVGEAVDAADDLRSILAEAVEDDAQLVLADLVRRLGDADRALSSREGLVASEEAEAASLLREEHGAEVAVAETDLAVVRNGARHAERLQAFADGFRSVDGRLDVLLDGDGSAERVRPLRVLERDRLEILYDLVRVDALVFADLLRILDGGNPILLADFVDFVNTALIAFE